MKKEIMCPECRNAGRKGKVLAKCEDLNGKGDLYLFCKVCKREVLVRVEDIGVNA